MVDRADEPDRRLGGRQRPASQIVVPSAPDWVLPAELPGAAVRSACGRGPLRWAGLPLALAVLLGAAPAGAGCLDRRRTGRPWRCARAARRCCCGRT